MRPGLLGSSTIAAIFVLVAGCAMGPDFKTPAAPEVKGYTDTPMGDTTEAAPTQAGDAQHFVSAQDIPAQWWTLFHSEALNELIHSAFTNNPSVAAAQATLREARESLAVGQGAYMPQADLQVQAARERFSGLTVGLPTGFDFTVYQATVNVSYNLDVFGGIQRQVESLSAQVEYQNFELEATYLTLAANVATAAIREASLRAQIQATQDVLDAQEKGLDLVKKQFQAGSVTRATVLAQQTQVAATRATLPALQKSLEQNRHLLAVLAGKLPGEGGVPEFNLDGLTLPGDLPVSLPSALARQRPDIRANEALLHAASAQIGVATANLYPQIGLTGSYGGEALQPQNLFSPANLIWSIAAGVTQPLFHGGELTAKRRAALATYDQALAQYRATILQAFQDVADTMRALESDAVALKTQAEAADLARQTLELTERQYRIGAVNYLALLDAERQYQSTRISVVQAQANRYADTAALFQSLGGGWWNRTEPLAEVPAALAVH